MVVAAQSAVLGYAIAEIGAPVWTVAVEQAIAAARVLVEHEILAHEAHGQRGLFVELSDGGDGLPVAPQELAHRRAGPDARQRLVLGGAEHGAA